MAEELGMGSTELDRVGQVAREAARICHYANKSICEASGDFSRTCWDSVSDEVRESAVAGARFRVLNPDAPVAAQHEAWRAHLEADGWKHGPVRSESRKEHPCLVDFDDLPAEDRVKDHVFVAIVLAVAAGGLL